MSMNSSQKNPGAVAPPIGPAPGMATPGTPGISATPPLTPEISPPVLEIILVLWGKLQGKHLEHQWQPWQQHQHQ